MCAHVRFDSNQAWLVSANGLMKQEVIQTQAMRVEHCKVVLKMQHKPTHKALHHLKKKMPMRHIYYQPISVQFCSVRLSLVGNRHAFETYLLSTNLGPVLFRTTEFGWLVKHSSNWMSVSTYCTSEDM